MREQNKVVRNVEFFLRLCILPLSVASLWVMVKNKQVTDDFGKVEFSNISGLKYLVWINAISSGYALASTALKILKFSPIPWILFIFDQAMAYLMVSSFSAVAEVLYLAHDGDQKVTWSEVCSYYGKFCSRIQVSLVLHVLALLFFVALSLLSAHNLFTKFDPPTAPSKEVVRQ